MYGVCLSGMVTTKTVTVDCHVFARGQAGVAAPMAQTGQPLKPPSLTLTRQVVGYRPYKHHSYCLRPVYLFSLRHSLTIIVITCLCPLS